MRFIDLIDDGRQYRNPGFQRKGISVSHYALIAQLGFIREILREQTPQAECPSLFTHTIQATDPVEALITQSERILPHVRACIRRAQEEGTSLVLEGSHLLPTLYHNIECDLYVVMATPPIAEHQRRLLRPSHTRRLLTTADVQRACLIADHLEHQAAAFWAFRAPYVGATETILLQLRSKTA
jgi:2-phosphoglycerate kinase